MLRACHGFWKVWRRAVAWLSGGVELLWSGYASRSSKPNNARPTRSIDQSPASRPKSRPSAVLRANMVILPLFERKGGPLRISVSIGNGRLGHPKRLGGLNFRRTAGQTDVAQICIAEIHQLAARMRAAPPLGKALFTWLQRNLRRERRLVMLRLIVLMCRSHQGR